MTPIETAILGGAEVSCEWEPATVERAQFTPGYLYVRIGHLGFSLTYETGAELMAALAKAQPEKLSRDLEESVRMAVERNAQRARPALVLVARGLGEHLHGEQE